ncbi:hypothetical protein B0H10DRAFT_2193290 [Mycena sp. CBHHK59/15]|nr:hypothetical protein B0H10DRAFT_2193290 [Mycena sp. CBHHK59/15]
MCVPAPPLARSNQGLREQRQRPVHPQGASVEPPPHVPVQPAVGRLVRPSEALYGRCRGGRDGADCCRATRIGAGELDDERAPSAKGDGGGVDAAVVLQGQHGRGEGARGPETMASPAVGGPGDVGGGGMAMSEVQSCKGDSTADCAVSSAQSCGAAVEVLVVVRARWRAWPQSGETRGGKVSGYEQFSEANNFRGRTYLYRVSIELGKKNRSQRLEVFGIRLNGSFGPKLPFSRLASSQGVEGGRQGSGRAERVPADRIDGKRKIVPADINILIMIG